MTSKIAAKIIAPSIFAADPSAHVFDGRLYLYVSYDEPFTNTHDSMVCYHSLSTDDLNTWVDHGRILHLENVPWAISHMWAIDANKWKGKYYLTFCAFDEKTSTMRTGLAISDRPEGPFTDLGPIEGVEWGQDPALYIEDQSAYLVWGAKGQILIAELNSDLRSVKSETIRNLSKDIAGYEGPFLHKYNDTYYLTFPALDKEKWPQRMCYATAKNVLGPYTFGGIFIPEYEGNSGTIHGSVVEFQGKWLAFYHSAWISGMSTSRSLMMSEISYGEDGSINELDLSKKSEIVLNSTQVLDVSVAPLTGGHIYGAHVAHDGADFTGAGFITGLVRQEFGVSVLSQIGLPGKYEISVRYRSFDEPFNGRVVAGNHLFYDGNQNQDYEQYINRGTIFPPTQGKWVEFLIGEVTLPSGNHQVRVSASHTLDAEKLGIDLDFIRVKQISYDI
jgi:predicted GH43/DUF377 family glycosyl hydrolase